MINHFDFGLAYGYEIKHVNDIYNKLNIPYKIYGFEANSTSIKHCLKKYSNNKNIQLIHGAISNSKEDYIKLYLQDIEKWVQQGNSIYKTKNNVNINKTKLVKKIIFSEWVKENKIDLDNSINIIRMNIEGAEWDLLTDLENNNLINKMHIYMGDNLRDIHKVKELINDNVPEKLSKLVKRNNISIFRYCSCKFSKNIYFQKLLLSFLPNIDNKLLINNFVKFINPKSENKYKNGQTINIKWTDLENIEYPVNLTLRMNNKQFKFVNYIALNVEKNKEISWIINKNNYSSNEFVILIESVNKYPLDIQISDVIKIE